MEEWGLPFSVMGTRKWTSSSQVWKFNGYELSTSKSKSMWVLYIYGTHIDISLGSRFIMFINLKYIYIYIYIFFIFLLFRNQTAPIYAFQMILFDLIWLACMHVKSKSYFDPCSFRLGTYFWRLEKLSKIQFTFT